MRIAIMSLFLAAAGSASASFELVLALDYSNNQVHRIDGENNLYLGSFGRNRLVAPSGMAVQQSTNRVHVYDSNFGSVLSFDYNTGELVAERAIASLGYAQFAMANNGDFLIGDYSSATARRYSQAGNLLTVFTAPFGATAARAIMQGPEGNYYIAWAGSNSITRHSSTGAIVNTAVASDAILADTRQMFIQNNQVLISSGSGGKWLRSNYVASGSWGTVNQFSGFANTYGVSGSHFNTVYVGGNSTAGTGVLNSYHQVTGTNTSTLTIPGAGSVVALATVIAPEPGSMAIIGVGLAGLAKASRRKRALS